MLVSRAETGQVADMRVAAAKGSFVFVLWFFVFAFVFGIGQMRTEEFSLSQLRPKMPLRHPRVKVERLAVKVQVWKKSQSQKYKSRSDWHITCIE